MKLSTRNLIILGSVLFSIPLAIYALWIYAAGQAPVQAERVDIFHSYFPTFLRGRWSTTYLSIVLLVGALVCYVKAIDRTTGLLKIVCLILILAASLLLFLNLWSMM